jgi:hypothetical protein
MRERRAPDLTTSRTQLGSLVQVQSLSRISILAVVGTGMGA